LCTFIADTMSDLIQLLPDSVANQIAAGEVIQRPASAVKELLENAIDAGSTQIEVIVKDSGKTLLQIIDNGCGMSPTDARMSFERHATSKIRSAHDLFSIRTMGFRGEALASIAAVAQVELKTRRHDDEVGTAIRIEGSEVKEQEAVSTPVGTSFSVKNLFYNIPARRNFLKSNPVEARHIIDEFERVALANSQVAMSLYQNGMEVFRLPVGNFRQRIVSLYGSNYNERLVPVQEDTMMMKVHGFVGKPEFSKKSRGEQFFFVNNRFIKDHYLNHAVSNAFDELLPKDSYPSYWIHLEIDPSKIDVNIHPTKTEIKFEDERAVYAIIRAAVKRSLGQYSITPTLDFDKERAFDVPYSDQFKPVNKPGVMINTGYNPFDRERESKPIQTAGWEKLYEGLRNESATAVELPLEHEIHFTAEHQKADILFQLSNAIIVTKLPSSGMLLIDQQAAHERILLERLLSNIPEKVGTQNELFPVTMQFSAQDASLLNEIKEEIARFGFDLREFGMNSFVLHGRPDLLEKGKEKETLELIIEEYKHFQSLDVADIHKQMAASLARSMSIKRGTILSAKEMQRIVDDLLKCNEPALGIDGKPCSWLLTADEVLSKLKR
jgi:DNA mismatch repair protein MutL